jgi:hypothetical protein
MRTIATTALLLFTTWTAYSTAQVNNKDAYIQGHNGSWVIGTSAVETTIRLDGHSLGMTSFRNKLSRTEYVGTGAVSDEIRFSLDGKEVTGANGGWSFARQEGHKLAQGGVQLDLTVRNERVEVTKHYVAYPGVALIREWMTVRNISTQALQLADPAFLRARVLSAGTNGWDLYYMTGGGPYNGSQLLKKEVIGQGYKHEFDSHANGETASYTAYTVYLPLIVLQHPASNEGVMVGWDYMGHWTARAGKYADGPFQLSLQVSNFQKTLAPGEAIETPRAFLGVFNGDLDAMGNSLLDWQYEYMWDLTNSDYFAKTRWLVDWPQPWVASGGSPSGENWGRRLALDLRYVDLMRQSGADILWDDAGWYDRWGTWNGPEWKLTTDYLRKHDMKWLLWWPTFMAHPLSPVAQTHPEWIVPGQPSLDQSIAVTADYQKGLLDNGVKSWGDFQWRFDAPAAISKNDTDALAADQNLRSLIERFKHDHPASGVDVCFAGGRWISYDMARLADSGEYTDGGVGPYTAYYTSLLVPPDKYHNVVDFDHTYYNAASDRTHLSLDPVWYRDPGDGPDVEAIRRDWEIYHYLVAQGVAGWWSHVFRPTVEHDDPIWYFQRMDRTQAKGVIITRHAKTGPTYYLVAKQIKKSGDQGDVYFGPTTATTTSVAGVDSSIYEDPVDAQPRFYGVRGEMSGPLNFKYLSGGGETSFIKSVTKLGGVRGVGQKFFGMALQVGAEPVTVTQVGMIAGDLEQFENGLNRGSYRVTIVRGEDGALLGSADLDMSQGAPDALGFKYVKLSNPVRLDTGPAAVVIRPRGLDAQRRYEVSCDRSDCREQKTGAELMRDGVRLASVQPGELIYLNLPMHPGSGADTIAPRPPTHVTKRIGSNLGVQGVEMAWAAGSDDNWISYYEVLRDGVLLTKVAKGTFFFDHSGNAQSLVPSRYEVRTVDGDGNRSALAKAELVAGEGETYRALGGFSEPQGEQPWRYEQSLDGESFQPMIWTSGGYEGLRLFWESFAFKKRDGRWTGSGLAQIGRIWMQPGAASDVARVFVAPASGTLSIVSDIRKDPSARNGNSVGARVLLNDRQLWPATGWQQISPEYENVTSLHLDAVTVKAGDVVRFVVQHTGSGEADPVIWDPTIAVERRP